MFNGIGIDFGASECRAAIGSGGDVRPLPEVSVPGEPVEVAIDKKRTLLVHPLTPNGERVSRWLRLATVKANLGTGLGQGAEAKATLQFQKLLANLAVHLEADIVGASLAVPSYYGINQRGVLRAACVSAGFTDIALLEESVAAAMYTYRDHTAQGHLLAYCLGQSIFSVSVVALGNGTPSAVWHEGSTQLGGQDFEAMLVQYIIESLRKNDNVALGERSRTVLRQMIGRAERAKIALAGLEETSAAECDLEIGPFRLSTGGSFHRHVKVSGALLDEVAMPLVEHTIALSQKAVAGVGLQPRDLAAILLVGKPARCSLVKRCLRDSFPGVTMLAAEDHAVACGAAMHAASSHVCFKVPRTMPLPVLPAREKRNVYELVRAFGEVRVDAKVGGDLDGCVTSFRQLQARARQELGSPASMPVVDNAHAVQGNAGPSLERWQENKQIQEALIRACDALAVALCRAGRSGEANRLLQTTATQWPGNLVIRDGLIRTYGDLAKHLCSIDASSQALDLLKGALACWPDHEGLRRLVAGVCSRRARRLMEEGRLPYARVELEEARRQLQEGLRHQAESVDLLRDLANVHLMLAESYSQRQAGRGIRYFRQQNEKDQTTWQLHYKKALIHLERILQLDPGNERARSDRSQLREVLFVPASRAQRRRGGRRR